MSAPSILLEPFNLGSLHLPNRVVMPPLTRHRATADFVPTPRMALYYQQRASAGLLISEGIAISPAGVGYPRVPGIWNQVQVDAWRAVTTAVHDAGGRIFAQLWHVGRVSHSRTQPSRQTPVAPSAIKIDQELVVTPDGEFEFEVPRAMSSADIRQTVQDYERAAQRCVEAGFDGIEIHGANGYLIDQFVNDATNRRSDEYGGPIANRMRFLDEVVDTVIAQVGADRVGVRLSPSTTWMQCDDSDKESLYSEVAALLNGKGLAYLHLIEPTIAANETVRVAADAIESGHFRKFYEGTIIVAGDHTPESAAARIGDGTADLVAFGRAFIANPDLPHRIAVGAELATADRTTFYTYDDEGYIDYPTLTAV